MKKPELEHSITLTLGDWSHDGHSQTEVITVKCNVDKKDLEKAYKKGTKKVGFDLTEDVCADYEDGSVSDEVIEKLRDAGIKPEDFAEKGDADDEGWSLAYDYEAFAGLWMRIAQLGDPDLKYEVAPTNPNNINIGGYGLFGS